MYIGMFRPKKRGENCFGGIDSTLIVSPDPSSEYMEGEAISKNYLSHKFVRVTNTQAPLVKDK